MALTDVRVRTVKAGEKPRKLADGGGLYLLVNRAGKYWRWKYRLRGKEKVMALGVYPAVSLAQARELHKQARTVLDSGGDPMAQKKQADGQTFEAIARQWWAHWSPGRNERYAAYVIRRLEEDIFPEIALYIEISGCSQEDRATRGAGHCQAGVTEVWADHAVCGGTRLGRT